MSLENLTPDERQVILQCLQAAVEGPFFPEWEFHTLFGLTREEVREVVAGWSSIDDSEEIVQCAINNAMNHLLSYPHRRFEVWQNYISVSPTEVAEVFRKWRGDEQLEDGSKGYFNRLQ